LLVSLAVLGVIAGLTVPSIVASVDRGKNRSILKEAFQIVSSITNAGVLNGDFDNITSWDFVTDNGAGSISNYFSSKLNYSKQCLTSDITSEGCKRGWVGMPPDGVHNKHNARWILPSAAKIQFNRVGTDIINSSFILWTVTSKAYANDMKQDSDNPDTIVFECQITQDLQAVDLWGGKLKPGMCGAIQVPTHLAAFNTVFN
jgi:type II secretory pathway pseudopilin PulG